MTWQQIVNLYQLTLPEKPPKDLQPPACDVAPTNLLPNRAARRQRPRVSSCRIGASWIVVATSVSAARAMRLAIFCALVLGASLVVGTVEGSALAQVQPTQPIQPLGEWHTQEGRAPDLADSSECRNQARRVAQMYANQQIPGLPDGRDEREVKLYDQCMRSKGFTR